MTDAHAPELPGDAAALPTLDAAAMTQLQALDPTGRGEFVRRVLLAFESSSARLLQQLEVARAATDRPAMRLVAHTLKSSSAAIGAPRLSQLCAAAEKAIRLGTPDLDSQLDALQVELDEILTIVTRMLKELA